MKQLPDLEAWAIFARVVQLGSFSKASQDLGVTQATISKAISRLEARLKTALFHRTSRQLTLTESGQIAVERAERILLEGQTVEQEMTEQSSRLRGPIRITMPMSFGISCVAPVLPDFMRDHPEVSLDIQFSDQQVDLVGNRLDLALRISQLQDSSLLARKLATVRILLVGSPAYFKQHGEPAHPSDLSEHQVMLYSQTGAAVPWRFSHADKGEATVFVPGMMLVNNAEALNPVLEAGLGLALQPEFMVWQELRDGRLRTAMDDWQVHSIALHLVTPPSRSRPARVSALMDYLAERLSGAPWSYQAAPENR